jgi:hypothetical protein
MSAEQTRNRIEAAVWKALAQSRVDTNILPKEEVEKLIDAAVDGALLELGKILDEADVAGQEELEADPELALTSGEKELWRGRPFWSLTTRYLITNQRVRVIRGVLGKDREDVELVRVQDMDLAQSVRERLLGVGDILIHSHDASHPEITLNNVRDPEKVHEILRQAVRQARRDEGLIYREEM